MGCLRKAGELAKEALRIARKDSILWTHYAKIEAAKGDYPKARALYRQACNLNPNDWYVATPAPLISCQSRQRGVQAMLLQAAR